MSQQDATSAINMGVGAFAICSGPARDDPVGAFMLCGAERTGAVPILDDLAMSWGNVLHMRHAVYHSVALLCGMLSQMVSASCGALLRRTRGWRLDANEFKLHSAWIHQEATFTSSGLTLAGLSSNTLCFSLSSELLESIT